MMFRTMMIPTRRLLVAGLTAIGALSLVACDDSGSDQQRELAPSQPQETPSQPAPQR